MSRAVPIETRLRNGNPSKRPLPDPRPVGGRVDKPPAPPADFSPEAKRLWKRYAGLLVKGGVYDAADAAMVEVAVGLHVQLKRIRRAVEALAEDELTVAGGATIHKHPLLSAQVETAGALRLAIAELGMSPVARTKLPKRGPADVEEDISRDIGPSPMRRIRIVNGED